MRSVVIKVLKTGPNRPVESVGPRTSDIYDSVWSVKPEIIKPSKNRRTGRKPDGWAEPRPGGGVHDGHVSGTISCNDRASPKRKHGGSDKRSGSGGV
ncbi:hypothetical protein PIB30_070589 [Stylosanthes scabra]|uniref:Uncharacterized protein n=1 Tax=Stylosanthes scabra TaxID=79078 RepID=A0ABU6XLZ1_9FABA|nr:hypothetical protein [Stylosanthes scabra]